MALLLQSGTLRQIFSEVLGNLAFMFTSDPPEVPALEGRWLECCIEYHGSEHGRLGLRCTSEFAQLLAGNLLGTDTQDEQATQAAYDSVKELMNVLCGQLVTTLHGTQGIFDLTIPEIKEVEGPLQPVPVDQIDFVEVYIENNPIQITYTTL